jgi:hypothetical protein
LLFKSLENFQGFFFALNTVMKITCYTLFDVTRTGINFRNRFDTSTSPELAKQRNQQSNFETILQVISMRSQPENITDSVRVDVKIEDLNQFDFGYLYTKKYLKNTPTISVWSFDVEIEQIAVFNNGITELGFLLADCENVPMIINLDEQVKLSNHLDTTDENRNIQFCIVPETESQNEEQAEN